MNTDINNIVESLIDDINSAHSDRFVAIARAALHPRCSASKPFWQISYDSLRPRLSFETEDNVPFVFEGGTSNDGSFEMSPLENALNGLIHLETFVLAAIDEKRACRAMQESRRYQCPRWRYRTRLRHETLRGVTHLREISQVSGPCMSGNM